MKTFKLVMALLCGLWFLSIAFQMLFALKLVIALVISGALCYAFLKSAIDEGRGPRIGY